MQFDTTCAVVGAAAVAAFLMYKPKPAIVYHPESSACSARKTEPAEPAEPEEPVEVDAPLSEGFSSCLDAEATATARPNATPQEVNRRVNGIRATLATPTSSRSCGSVVLSAGRVATAQPTFNPANASCFNLPAAFG